MKNLIYRWKHPSLESHLWGIVQGFAEIADGIITLSTLGFFGSGFEMAVARKRVYRHIQFLKKRAEK